MAHIATWSQKSAGEHVERGLLGCRHESVAGMMTVTTLDVACYAKIIVITLRASYEVRFIKIYPC